MQHSLRIEKLLLLKRQTIKIGEEEKNQLLIEIYSILTDSELTRIIALKYALDETGKWRRKNISV